MGSPAEDTALLNARFGTTVGGSQGVDLAVDQISRGGPITAKNAAGQNVTYDSLQELYEGDRALFDALKSMTNRRLGGSFPPPAGTSVGVREIYEGAATSMDAAATAGAAAAAARKAEIVQLRKFIENNASVAGAEGAGSGGFTTRQLEDGRYKLTATDDPEKSIVVSKQAMEQYLREEAAKNAAAEAEKNRNRQSVPLPQRGGELQPPQPPAGQDQPLIAGGPQGGAGFAAAVTGAVSGMTTPLVVANLSPTGSIAGSPNADNTGPAITGGTAPVAGVSTVRS